MHANSRKRSAVWRLMSVLPDNKLKVQCNLCPVVVSRGTEKSQTTSNMKNHLLNFHRAQYEDAEKASRPPPPKESSVGTVDLTQNTASRQHQVSLEVSVFH